MTSPSKDAWNHAYEWRKQAAEERKVARRALKYLRSKNSTLPKAMMEALDEIDDVLNNPEAPEKLQELLRKFHEELSEAERHIEEKLDQKDISKKNRKELEARLSQWINTWNALFDVSIRTDFARKFDTASKTMMELSDILLETNEK